MHHDDTDVYVSCADEVAAGLLHTKDVPPFCGLPASLPCAAGRSPCDSHTARIAWPVGSSPGAGRRHLLALVDIADWIAPHPEQRKFGVPMCSAFDGYGLRPDVTPQPSGLGL